MQKLTSRSSAAFALISAIGLLLISASASAFHHHEKGQQRGPIVIDEVAERAKTAGARQFQKADANNDDFISLDEFEQHTPKRGFRDKARRQRGMGGPIMASAVEREKMRALIETEMFALLDADKDGSVSDTEFKAGNGKEQKRLARKRAMFKMLDSNEDGKLSKDEMPNPEKSLRALDSNNDGVVDRAEMAKLRKRWKQ